MNINNKKGAVPLIPIIAVLIVGILGMFAVNKLTSSSNTASPTAIGKSVEKNLQEQAKTDKKILEDKAAQSKIGQQYVTAEGLALDKVTSDDPAVLLLKNLNPRANLALNNGLGPLDVEQERWAIELVLNSLSAEAAKRSVAEQSLKNKDKELQGSIVEVKSLNTKNIQLEETNKDLTDKLVQEDAAAVNFRSKIYWAIGSLIFIVIGLPILSAAFPALAGFTNGLGAFISPFLHKAKVEAENMAKDAVGVVHELEVKAGEAGTIAKADFEKIKAEWISEAHKNVHLYDDIKRKLSLI